MLPDEYLARLTCSRSLTYSLIKRVLLLLCLIPGGVAAGNGIETVTLQLKWQHQFQFAGYYAALEKGYYREVGLDVKIQPHGPGLKSPVVQVLSGAAQYGITDSGLVKDRLDGKPVVALAAIFQRSPLIWLVRQDSDIRGPHDLVNKRVMYLPGLQSSDLLAMLQVEGIPASKINLIPSSFNIQDLIDGHTDAFNGYSTNEPYILREQGIPYRIINPRNYGIDFYGDVLFTSESEIDEHPERVKAFHLASLKGWKYAMEHPDEIIDLISTKYASNKSRSHLEFEAEAMRELIMSDLVTIGHMNPGRWRVIAERLVALEFTKANYNLLEGFIYDPSPKPQDLRQFYLVISLLGLLMLFFMSLAIWIGQLNIRLKNSEAKLRTSKATLKAQYKAIPIPTYTWQKIGKDMVLVNYNDAAEEITRGGIADLVGKKASEMYRHMPEIQEEISRCLAEKTTISRDMAYVFQTTGESKYMAVKYAFAPPNLCIVHTEDITERKQAEEEKERLQRELQQARNMEALGQLTGGIAHDFNNILGIIMGYTRMVLDRYGTEVPEKVVDYLGSAMTASERAKGLVDQMLTFGRSDNRDMLPLQLVPQVEENLEMLHSILPSSIRIELNCEDDLPSILMDPVKLQQLIMNLCINARDAMDGVGTLTINLAWQRGIDAECSACHKRVKGDWIELSVADTGNGMTPEVLERLFEPFFTTKEVGKGTGMGMAVLHGIISGHEGHVLVETELGKGTTFRLLFPPIIEETPEMPDADQSSDELPQGAGKHVLVVDDEPGLAEYIGELLELHGYQTTIKTDGQEALDLFQKDPGKFALLVTDQTMPRLTGVELIKQLREIRPELPVILCTGFSKEIDAEGAEAMGIRYLGKPIDADRLIQSAGELLGLT